MLRMAFLLEGIFAVCLAISISFAFSWQVLTRTRARIAFRTHFYFLPSVRPLYYLFVAPFFYEESPPVTRARYASCRARGRRTFSDSCRRFRPSLGLYVEAQNFFQCY